MAYEQRLVEHFRKGDANNDGTLDRQELHKVLRALAKALPHDKALCDDEIERVLSVADCDGGGRIHYEEFVQWVLGNKDAKQAFPQLRSSRGSQRGDTTPMVRFHSQGSMPIERLSSRRTTSVSLVRRRKNTVSLVCEEFVSQDPRAPLKAVHYPVFKSFNALPRSSDGLAVSVAHLDHDVIKIIFISHRWLRPWETQAECEANGEIWAGFAHPDNHKSDKFKACVDGIEVLVKENGWNPKDIYLWLDYACVDQDNPELKVAGIKSLLSYAAACELVLVPVSELPKFAVAHMVPDRYGERAWTRLEAFAFYVLSLLRGKALPQLYTCDHKGKVLRIDYDLLPDAMPAHGSLTNIVDLEHIMSHQETLIDSLQRRACCEAANAMAKALGDDSGGVDPHCDDDTSKLDVCQTCVGPALIAMAALGNIDGVRELLELGVFVDQSDNRGYTALISASRYDHADIVEILLAADAYVETENSFGWTPLVMCARKGNAHMAKLLLDAEADPEHGCKGKSPLQLAQAKSHHEVAKLLEQRIAAKAH